MLYESFSWTMDECPEVRRFANRNQLGVCVSLRCGDGQSETLAVWRRDLGQVEAGIGVLVR